MRTALRRSDTKRMVDMTWVLVGAAIAGIALADLAMKQSGGRISPSAANLVIAVTALLLPAAWAAIDSQRQEVRLSWIGVSWASIAGVALSAVAGLLLVIFDRGLALSVGTPIVRAGGLVLAAALGMILLGERADLRSIAGLLLTLVGILLIASR